MTHHARFVLINTTKTTLGPPSLIQYLHGQELFADYIYAPKDADAPYNNQELKLLVDKVCSYPIVGISSFTISERRSFQLAKAIKIANPSTHVVMGGPNVIMDPERILLESAADSVCIYEGELPLESLVGTLGIRDVMLLPGLWFKKNGLAIKNPYAEVVQDLDNIPFENYKASQFGKYWRLNSNGFSTERTLIEPIENPCMQGNFLYMMTTRGCPYSCSYCINSTLNDIARYASAPRLRRMTPARMVKALSDVISEDPGVERIFFFDDDFSLRSEEELRDFAGCYKSRIGLPFYIFANPNTTSNAKLEIYQDAGLQSMELGVQTISEKVLRKYNRTQNAADLRRILTRSVERRYTFDISFDIITNSPFEDPDDIVQNIRYILTLPGSFEMYVHSLHLFPGTPLRKEYGGGTGNECHEYQDNFSTHPTQYFNEFHTKIIFAMQGWHPVSDPETFGTLSRHEILSMLESPKEHQKEVIAELDERMGQTRAGRYYGELHKV